MGYLSQAASGVTNAQSITISAWVQRINSSSNITILEFGDQFADLPDQTFASNRIALRTDLDGLDNGNAILLTYLSGVRGSQSRLANLSGDSANPEYIAEVAKEVAFGDAVTPYTSLRSGHTELVSPGDLTISKSLNEKTASGNWFHLLLSADMSTIETEAADGSGTWNIGWCFVNGENHGNGGQNQPEDPIGGVGTENGDIIGKLFTNVFDVTGHESFAVYFDAHVMPDYGSAAISIPAWDIGINGFEFGVPTTGAGITNNAGVRLAEVMVWVGQCIDPNVYMDKFVTIADGYGSPANPAIAALAFGEPNYRIKGPAATAQVNGGVAGDLVETGTVSDVTGSPVRFAVA